MKPKWKKSGLGFYIDLNKSEENPMYEACTGEVFKDTDECGGWCADVCARKGAFYLQLFNEYETQREAKDGALEMWHKYIEGTEP